MSVGQYKGTKENFDFLGFTFYNTKARGGKYRIGVRTSKKKLKAKRQVAKACGYKNAVSVDNFADLDRALEMAKVKDELTFIEVKCALGAREDLGRPTTTAIENKQNFMGYLQTL